MAKEKSKDDIIQIQGSIIKRLQTELYTIMVTGNVPKINAQIRKRNSFKKFLKENEAVQDMIDNKTIDLQMKLKKAEKVIKKHNLQSNMHITGLRYVRIATYIDDIDKMLRDIVNCNEEYYTLPNGYKVRPTSLRYQTFNRSLECVNCGLKGRFLALERCLSDKGGNEGDKEGQGFHLNLYALDKNGCEVLMTKDHILPKSKGGPDHIDNLQTMCTCCNAAKGDKVEVSA